MIFVLVFDQMYLKYVWSNTNTEIWKFQWYLIPMLFQTAHTFTFALIYLSSRGGISSGAGYQVILVLVHLGMFDGKPLIKDFHKS